MEMSQGNPFVNQGYNDVDGSSGGRSYHCTPKKKCPVSTQFLILFCAIAGGVLGGTAMFYIFRFLFGGFLGMLMGALGGVMGFSMAIEEGLRGYTERNFLTRVCAAVLAVFAGLMFGQVVFLFVAVFATTPITPIVSGIIATIISIPLYIFMSFQEGQNI